MGDYPWSCRLAVSSATFSSSRTSTKEDANHEDYQKNYHAAMSGQKIPQSPKSAPDGKAKAKPKVAKVDVEAAREAARDTSNWADSADTTRMWSLISSGDIESLQMWLSVDPKAVFMRSADGRGPLWWAHEYHQKKIIDLLLASGVDAAATDINGVKPSDLD